MNRHEKGRHPSGRRPFCFRISRLTENLQYPDILIDDPGIDHRSGDVEDHQQADPRDPAIAFDVLGDDVRRRSEEHTSELQSRRNLVCRLLLEKKKP